MRRIITMTARAIRFMMKDIRTEIFPPIPLSLSNVESCSYYLLFLFLFFFFSQLQGLFTFQCTYLRVNITKRPTRLLFRKNLHQGMRAPQLGRKKDRAVRQQQRMTNTNLGMPTLAKASAKFNSFPYNVHACDNQEPKH